MSSTHKLVSGVGCLPTLTLGKPGVPQQKCVILGSTYYHLVKVNEHCPFLCVNTKITSFSFGQTPYGLHSNLPRQWSVTWPKDL